MKDNQQNARIESSIGKNSSVYSRIVQCLNPVSLAASSSFSVRNAVLLRASFISTPTNHMPKDVSNKSSEVQKEQSPLV